MSRSDSNNKKPGRFVQNKANSEIQNRLYTPREFNSEKYFHQSEYCIQDLQGQFSFKAKTIGFSMPPTTASTKKTVEKKEVIKLSEKDAVKFVEEIWNSPGPSEELKAAYARYKKRTGR